MDYIILYRKSTFLTGIDNFWPYIFCVNNYVTVGDIFPMVILIELYSRLIYIYIYTYIYMHIPPYRLANIYLLLLVQQSTKVYANLAFRIKHCIKNSLIAEHPGAFHKETPISK